MRFLKTNTATRVTVGPFLDKTDGITPEVSLTATNEHLTLMVDTGGVPTLVLDADATASGGNNDFVHVTNDDAGFYDLELTAAQLNYVGRAMLSINYVTDHCPVFHEFMILSAQAYDALYGTGNFSADVIAISGDTTAADNCELMFDGTGYAGGTAKLQVDAIAISGDTTAADNCELMFDGTGYAGGTARLKVDVDTIKTQAITCAAGVTVLASVGTAATSTAQTGDSYAIVASGVFGNQKLGDAISVTYDQAVLIHADVDAILEDTGTTLDGIVDTLTTEMAKVPKSDSTVTFNATALASINAEVVDAIHVDTHSELTAVPAANASLVDKVNWLFTLARNKLLQTATTSTLRNDADGADIATSTVSDNGTTFTRGEWT